MIIKAEIVKGKCFLLSHDGTILRVSIDYGPYAVMPVIEVLDKVDRARIDQLMRPSLLLQEEWWR